MKKYERIVLNIPHASIEGIAESGWQQGKSALGSGHVKKIDCFYKKGLERR